MVMHECIIHNTSLLGVYINWFNYAFCVDTILVFVVVREKLTHAAIPCLLACTVSRSTFIDLQ